METTPVVIIGAGPTGLMLGLELALFKIPFRLLTEQVKQKPAFESRAITIHPRTFELLARHGLAGRFLATGCPLNNIKTYIGGRCLLSKSDYPGSMMGDTAYQLTFSINQALTEKFLEERLMEYGVQVEKGMAVEKVVMDKDNKSGSVWVRNLNSTGDGNGEKGEVEVINARYIVGCDGAHSTVRKSAGIKFDGITYNEEFILADVNVEWNYEKVPHFFVDKGYIALFPMDKDKNIYRIVCRRPASSNPSSAPTNAKKSYDSSPSKSYFPRFKYQQPTLSDFTRAIASFVPGNVKIHSPTWFSAFRVSRRIASTFRLGPIILAGDAAHVNSPVGGQGMNTGMQDSVNLGWKLARVLHHNAPESLLDSYEIERRKIAQAVIDRADSQYLRLATTNPFKIWLRNILMCWVYPLFTSAKTADKNIRRGSQLGIRYRHSPIVGTASSWKGNLRGGDRVPDGLLVNSTGNKVTLHEVFKDPCDHLLLFGDKDNLDLFIAKNIMKLIESYSSGLMVVKIYNHKLIDEERTDVYADAEGKIHSDFQFTEPGYILVRPDGHISFIGPLNSLGEPQSWIISQSKD